MDKWETLERKEKKGDILLKMIAISGGDAGEFAGENCGF